MCSRYQVAGGREQHAPVDVVSADERVLGLGEVVLDDVLAAARRVPVVSHAPLRGMVPLDVRRQPGRAARHGPLHGRVHAGHLRHEHTTCTHMLSSGVGSRDQRALTRHVDELDSYNRKDALLFSGIPESDNEDCTAAVLSVTNSVMKINDLTQNSIRLCHRLGSRKPTGCRPILVRFHDIRMRNTVWNEKKSLRTSTTVIHEFLTRSRQTIFAVARRHFGIKNCWTRDGVIFVKIPNNDRRRIGTMEELDQLKENHPAVILMTPTDKQQSVGKPATTGLAVATVPIRQPSNRKTSAPSRLDK
ncbi:Uncharacterized protein OBRU01_22687 [Operophtera brumata]|uniref:Uncharacterized protein n=1 Tax=Operophtera brumata TaxID=104452 RepID=A0A0L7KL53_OPEBR|nr:Uncharacterized protein OBRU01_22687 [Operophtera brumata]